MTAWLSTPQALTVGCWLIGIGFCGNLAYVAVRDIVRTVLVLRAVRARRRVVAS